MKTFLIFLALSSLHLVHSEAGRNVSKQMKLKYVHGCLRALFNRIPEEEVRVLCQALIIRFLQEIKAEKTENLDDKDEGLEVIPKVDDSPRGSYFYSPSKKIWEKLKF